MAETIVKNKVCTESENNEVLYIAITEKSDQ